MKKNTCLMGLILLPGQAACTGAGSDISALINPTQGTSTEIEQVAATVA